MTNAGELRAAGQKKNPNEDARLLYNLLMYCEDAVKLMLCPDTENEKKIVVIGVECSVPVDAMTPMVLSDALGFLSTSAEKVYDALTKSDEGMFDHWQEDRKSLASDDDDDA